MRTSAPPRSEQAHGAAGAGTVAGRALASGLHVPRPAWLTGYTGLLVVLDATAMAAATLTAKISWLGINPESFHIRSFSIPYGALALLTVPTWVVLLALAGAYDLGPFATSPRSWIQVVRAGAQLLAVVAVSYYILHLEMLGRGVLVGLVPLAVALTFGARAGRAPRARPAPAARAGPAHGPRRRDAARRRRVRPPGRRPARVGRGHRRALDPRQRGDRRRCRGRTDERERHRTAERQRDTRHPDGNGGGGDDRRRRPTRRRSGPATGARPLAAALARTGAETVIITGGLAQGELRDIAWMLEGTGVALLVTPAPADLQELPSVMRPVAGLPLLYLDR